MGLVPHRSPQQVYVSETQEALADARFVVTINYGPAVGVGRYFDHRPAMRERGFAMPFRKGLRP